MTLPKGTTTQANRGRGLYGGGASGHGSDYTDIVYLNIQSTGNTIQFGDLTTAPRTWIQGMGSATRAIWAGGSTSQGSPQTNAIEYVTIATTGNAADFGDLPIVQAAPGSLDNSIRGVFTGSYTNPSSINTMTYITIASTGNGSDFGDYAQSARYGQGGTSDSHGGLSE